MLLSTVAACAVAVRGAGLGLSLIRSSEEASLSPDPGWEQKLETCSGFLRLFKK